MENTHYYPTASNVSVFLNGYHIDQAYRLDYRESSPKIPIYGYNDYRYGRVVKGNEVINGMLIINFIFSGYLNAVLNKINTNGNSTYAKLNNFRTVQFGKFYADGEKVGEREIKQKIREAMNKDLPPPTTLSEKQQRAEYIASLLGEGQKNQKENETVESINSSIINGAFTTSQKDREWYANDEDYRNWTNERWDKGFPSDPPKLQINNPNIPSPISINTFGNRKINIDVYYQAPNLATWLVRFYDVYFTEINQQISQAGADGSSEPLYEIYNFISSHKETILLKG